MLRKMNVFESSRIERKLSCGAQNKPFYKSSSMQLNAAKDESNRV
jgi:hypothetical protein